MTDIERLEERFEMQLNLIQGSFNRLLEVLAEKKIITYEDSKQIVYGKNMLAMMDAMEHMNMDINNIPKCDYAKFGFCLGSNCSKYWTCGYIDRENDNETDN